MKAANWRKGEELGMDIRLTATEMGNLWVTCINNSLAKCILGYFLAKVEDTQIKPVIKFALENTEKQLAVLEQMFAAEKFPFPVGFTDEDVNLRAPRLFSDTFFMDYIKNMCKVGLGIYGLAYTMAARADVRTFFGNCLDQTQQLDQKATEVQLTKGVYIRPPYIPVPDRVDFIRSLEFLSGGLFGFGDKRPLIAMEITHLVINIQTNALGKALMIGFSQVARSQKIRMAAAASPRSDIETIYITLSAEIAKFSKDGAKMMIENGWLEEPPQSPDRKKLAGIQA
jgi:hypothetical protein